DAGRHGASGQDPLHRLLQFLRLAPDEVVGGVGEVWLVAVRRSPSLLLVGWPRLRVGTDAAGARPKGRRGRLEPARLGPIDRQNPPWSAAASDQPTAKPVGGRKGTSDSGRAPVPRRRRAGRDRRADEQDRAAGRDQLAAASPLGG